MSKRLPLKQILVSCLLFFSACCLAAPRANGAVVYSGLQNIAISQFDALLIDLDTGTTSTARQTVQQYTQYDALTQTAWSSNTGADIHVMNFVTAGGNLQAVYVPTAPGNLAGVTTDTHYASNLAADAEIDLANAPSGQYLGYLDFSMYTGFQFEAVTDAYVGFAFPIDGVNHNAWLRVDVHNDNGTLTVKDWAYETTPGLPIPAGSLVSIPEPSTLLLLLPAAACRLARRRQP